MNPIEDREEQEEKEKEKTKIPTYRTPRQIDTTLFLNKKSNSSMLVQSLKLSNITTPVIVNHLDVRSILSFARSNKEIYLLFKNNVENNAFSHPTMSRLAKKWQESCHRTRLSSATTHREIEMPTCEDFFDEGEACQFIAASSFIALTFLLYLASSNNIVLVSGTLGGTLMLCTFFKKCVELSADKNAVFSFNESVPSRYQHNSITSFLARMDKMYQVPSKIDQAAAPNISEEKMASSLSIRTSR